MNVLLGERIKELRNACGLKQEDMANKLNMSRQKYARIEKGMANITLETLKQLSDIFDVTINDITKVLEAPQVLNYRSFEDGSGSRQVLELLDLFYANKHLYEKINQKL